MFSSAFCLYADSVRNIYRMLYDNILRHDWEDISAGELNIERLKDKIVTKKMVLEMFDFCRESLI